MAKDLPPPALLRCTPIVPLLVLVGCTVGLDALPPEAGDTADAGRADLLAPTAGLVALYRFDERSGNRIVDQSGQSPPLDLTVADDAAVRWTDDGLRVEQPTLIASTTAADRISAAVRASNALTIEVVITPRGEQRGPARIVTISETPYTRNVTLAQQRLALVGRVRSSASDENGEPELLTVPVFPASGGTRRRVVLTHDASGLQAIYLDGEPIAQRAAGDSLASWDDAFRLALAAELDDSRHWVGTYHYVAVYARARDPREIANREDLSR
jgi:hypothetical protein